MAPDLMELKKRIRLPRTVIFFVLTSSATIFVGLFPFDFLPKNHVQWVSSGQGLSFNGAGISHTKISEPFPFQKAISVHIIVREPKGSKNWGPKEIFSLYDGKGSPTLLLGQWDRGIFLYSRYEKNDGKRWYKIFRTEAPILRGKDNIVTITFDEHEKAIYVNGQLSLLEKVRLKKKGKIDFSGSLVIGNSPRGKNGWEGEIKGLAIFNRTLLPEEITIHRRKIVDIGIVGLLNTRSCIGLYPFDERKGNVARNRIRDTNHFYIPDHLNSIAFSKFFVSHKEMRFIGSSRIDFLKNIVFFIPFGWFCSKVIAEWCKGGAYETFFITILSGALLSFLIESLQLLLPSRSPDILDIVANTMGSGIGMLSALMMRFLRVRKDHTG